MVGSRRRERGGVRAEHHTVRADGDGDDTLSRARGRDALDARRRDHARGDVARPERVGGVGDERRSHAIFVPRSVEDVEEATRLPARGRGPLERPAVDNDGGPAARRTGARFDAGHFDGFGFERVERSVPLDRGVAGVDPVWQRARLHARLFIRVRAARPRSRGGVGGGRASRVVRARPRVGGRDVRVRVGCVVLVDVHESLARVVVHSVVLHERVRAAAPHVAAPGVRERVRRAPARQEQEQDRAKQAGTRHRDEKEKATRERRPGAHARAGMFRRSRDARVGGAACGGRARVTRDRRVRLRGCAGGAAARESFLAVTTAARNHATNAWLARGERQFFASRGSLRGNTPLETVGRHSLARSSASTSHLVPTASSRCASQCSGSRFSRVRLPPSLSARSRRPGPSPPRGPAICTTLGRANARAVADPPSPRFASEPQA